MRDKAGRAHGIRVKCALVAGLNNLENLREHLRHAEGLRHIRRRKLRVDQVQRQRNGLAGIHLNLQALAHRGNHRTAVLHLARVQERHLGSERVVHAHPLAGTHHRVVQVISQGNNERIRELQHPVSTHA